MIMDADGKDKELTHRLLTDNSIGMGIPHGADPKGAGEGTGAGCENDKITGDAHTRLSVAPRGGQSRECCCRGA